MVAALESANLLCTGGVHCFRPLAPVARAGAATTKHISSAVAHTGLEARVLRRERVTIAAMRLA